MNFFIDLHFTFPLILGVFFAKRGFCLSIFINFLYATGHLCSLFFNIELPHIRIQRLRFFTTPVLVLIDQDNVMLTVILPFNEISI